MVLDSDFNIQVLMALLIYYRVSVFTCKVSDLEFRV
jgi:hypothetical protein